MSRPAYFTLALVLAGYYLAVAAYVGFFANPNHFLFGFADDAREYRAVAEWLIRDVPSEMIGRRSFVYPLFLGLAYFPFGDLGLWLAQAALWLMSGLLYARALSTLNLGLKSRVLGFMVFALSWTPILLSLTALTETLALFFFSCAGYLLCRDQLTDGKRWPLVAALAGLLAATKPNYAPLMLVVFVLMVLAQIRGRLHLSLTQFGLCTALALGPTVFQVFLNHRATGVTENSNIGAHVLQLSLYAQLLAKESGRTVSEVRMDEGLTQTPMKVMLEKIVSSPMQSILFVLKNLEENIRHVLYLDALPHPIENAWRKTLNSVFYWLHILMIIPLVMVLARLMKSGQDLSLVILASFFLLALLPTGISFWAADRWTAPLLTTWPLVYFRATRHLVRPISA